MKSVVAAWMLALGLITSHLGCCTVRMGDRCGTGLCDSACGDSTPCECGSCGTGGLPFAGVRSRIAGKLASVHCTSGCGEVYWDEHINEPPVCDPCGCNGEFTGDTCGSCPTALGRLRNLWTQHRYCPSNCETCPSDIRPVHGSNCSSCGTGHTSRSQTSHSHISPSSQLNAPMEYAVPSGQSMQSQPVPTTRPSTIKPVPQHVPVPDPNASIRVGSSDERIVIGSGVSKSRPASASKTTGGIRLTTNSR
jgi:hypothetical protein